MASYFKIKITRNFYLQFHKNLISWWKTHFNVNFHYDYFMQLKCLENENFAPFLKPSYIALMHNILILSDLVQHAKQFFYPSRFGNKCNCRFPRHGTRNGLAQMALKLSSMINLVCSYKATQKGKECDVSIIFVMLSMWAIFVSFSLPPSRDSASTSYRRMVNKMSWSNTRQTWICPIFWVWVFQTTTESEFETFRGSEFLSTEFC